VISVTGGWHITGVNLLVVSHIYLLSNKAMPGLLKIGLTTNSPRARAKELYSTGVPLQFELEKYWSVPPAELRRAERDIHKLLSAYRINKKREFFLIETDLAIKSVNEYVRQKGFRTAQSSDTLSPIDKLVFVLVLIAISIATYSISIQ